MKQSKVLGALVFAAAIGCSGDPMPSGEDTRMVDAGGHLLEMVFKGTGTPAVVFDAGMIGRMRNWTTARDSVSLHTRTVIFERAGFGNSEQGPSPRTAEQLSAELHTALQNAGVEFPVILVGHSAGGLFSRVFAARHPSDVAGLVFVDPATVAVYDYMRESDPLRWDSYVDEVTAAMDPPPGWFGQWEALPRTLDQAEQAWPVPDVPTVVLSALTAAGEWPMESDQDMEVWERTQRMFAGRIPGAEHVVLPEAHHMSVLEEAVLREKILEVWSRATQQ